MSAIAPYTREPADPRTTMRGSSIPWRMFWAIMIAGALDFSGDYVVMFGISRRTVMTEVNYFQSFMLALIGPVAILGFINLMRHKHAYRAGFGAKVFLVLFAATMALGAVTGLLRGNEHSYIIGDSRNLIVYGVLFAIADIQDSGFAEKLYALFVAVSTVVMAKLALAVTTTLVLGGPSPLLVRYLLKLTPYLIGLAMINIAWMAGKFQWKYLITFTAASITVFMSQTRGIHAGFLVAFVFLWGLFASVKRSRGLLGPSALLLFAVLFWAVKVWANPEAMAGKWSGVLFDQTVRVRLEQIDSFMALFWKHPVFGIGLGGYDPDYARFSEDLRRPYLQELEYHNLLAKLGLVGIGCFGTAFLALFYDCWRRIRNSASFRLKALIAGFAAGLIGMMVAAATNPYYSSIYFHTYVVLLLLLLSAAFRKETEVVSVL